jgi:GrpB-like predicted nucleotidyltransferase (UPF0157 family)
MKNAIKRMQSQARLNYAMQGGIAMKSKSQLPPSRLPHVDYIICEDDMGKELSEMTLEELWELFPIFLVPYDGKWNEYYNEMEDSIKKLLSGYPVDRISHIGSTAIHNIWAKNIVDVMVEIPQSVDMKEIAHILEQNGFIKMSDVTNRISLNMGYPENGFVDKVYHIHLRYAGDNAELYFRDYLNEHPDVAKEYETLKLQLWKQYEHNRNAYTDAKTDFISKWAEVALKEYNRLATIRQMRSLSQIIKNK